MMLKILLFSGLSGLLLPLGWAFLQKGCESRRFRKETTARDSQQ